MSKKKKKKRKAGFLSNLMTLAGGNAVAQLITIVMVPVITRIFPVDSFGAFSVFISIAAILTAVSSLNFGSVIMLPDTEGAKVVFVLASLINAVFSVAIFLVLWLFLDIISELVNWPGNMKILLFVAPMVFVAGMIRILDFWLSRQKVYKHMAFANVGTAIADRSCTIGLGFAVAGNTLGLITGKFFGQGFGLVLRLRERSVKEVLFTPQYYKLSTLKETAVRYKNFAFYSWSALVQQSNRQLPVLVIASAFSPVAAGLFALCRRVLAEPMQLIGQSLSKVFYQHLGQKYREEKGVKEAVLLIMKYCSLLILGPMITLGIVAPFLFSFVFGEQWMEAGVYTRYLIPLFIMTFIFRPMSGLFDLLEKQKARATFNVFYFIFAISGMFIGVYFDSIYIALGLYTWISVLIMMWRLKWLSSFVGVNAIELIRSFLPALVLAFLSNALFYLSIELFHIEGNYLLGVAVLVILLYFLLIWATDPFLRKKVNGMFV